MMLIEQSHGAKPATRAERVVSAVFKATLETLAQAGYAGLTIEMVAARAAVNKTTIYRRWPTKLELVRDALLQSKRERTTYIDTGAVREDLLQWLREHVAFITSPLGQGVVRTLMMEGHDSEIADIARALRSEAEELPVRILERGVTRGELSPDVPKRMILGLLQGVTLHRIFVSPCGVDEMALESLIDLILDGARLPQKR